MKITFTKLKEGDIKLPQQALPGIYVIEALEAKQVSLHDGTLAMAYDTGLSVEIEGGYGYFLPMATQISTSLLLYNQEPFTKSGLTPIFKFISGASTPVVYKEGNPVAYLIVHPIVSDEITIDTVEYVAPEPEDDTNEATEEEKAAIQAQIEIDGGIGDPDYLRPDIYADGE